MSDFLAPLTSMPPERVRRPFAVSKSSIKVGLVALLFFTANGAFFRFGAMTGLVWTAATALALVWFVRSPRLMSQLMAQHWAILLLPSFALLSTTWSASPVDTAWEGVQMLFTCIISLRIVQALTTRQIMIAMMIALVGATAGSVLNLATGVLKPVYEVNGAFLGIFTQKNNLAKAVYWGAFAVTSVSLIYRRPWIGIIYTVLSFPLTIIALSRTGQIGYGFILILLVLAAMRNMPIQSRILLPVLFGLTLAGLAIVYVATGGALIGDFLVLMGKNPTLTGRTVIWGLGLSVWQENMLVGIGLNSYWTSPVYADAVAFISNNVDDGLHGFHNVYVEYLVAFGIVGAGYLMALMVQAWVRLLRAYLTTRSLEAAIWLALLTGLIVFGGFEDSFSKARSSHFMLAIMAFSIARRFARERGAGRLS